MSHFYGVVVGQAKTEATRRGSKGSGVQTTAASWAGCVRVRLYFDEAAGVDRFEVEQDKWKGHGVRRVLAEGVVGE